MKHYFIVAKLICLVLFISINTLKRTKAQEQGYDLHFNNVIPPSPNASSLGKYVDIPVGHYTGTPNINIPIWEVKSHKLSLPISLSYHTSGLKVEEIASWVGLGWSLNAGGVITRSVNTTPDEKIDVKKGFYTGYGNEIDSIYNACHPNYSNCNISFENFLNNITTGTLDGEPDNFYFNFNGYSGKFFFDKDRNIHITPNQNIKIEPMDNLFSSWKITTENGTQYYFGTNNAIEKTMRTSNWEVSQPEHISSWYLTKIISHDNNDSITLSYTSPVSYSYSYLPSEKKEYPNCGNLKKYYSTLFVKGINLQCIETSIEKINFISDTNRLDLINTKRLDQIHIQSKSSVNPFKKFTFSYDYFISNDETGNPCYDEECQRLKLNSITESSFDGNLTKTHFFDYNEEKLPSRKSYAQDHWGYYNGKNNNTTLLCSKVFFGSLDAHFCAPAGTSDREPSFPEMSAGSLKKITYPTGGFTELSYEPHDYGYLRQFPVNNPVYEEYGFTPYQTYIVSQTNNCSETIFCNTQSPYNCSSNTYTYPTDPDEFYVLLIAGRLDETINASVIFSIYSEPHHVLIDEQVFFPVTEDIEQKFYYDLPDQSFTIEVKACNARIYATPKYRKIVNTIKVDPAGGLRIAKLSQWDGQEKVNEKIYEYKHFASEPNEPAQLYDMERSSGVLISEPVYTYYVDYCPYDTELGHYTTSHSYAPLGSTQGSHIGYYRVKETQLKIENGDTIQNGYSMFSYTSAKEYMDFSGFDNYESRMNPILPVKNFDYRRGALIKKSVCNNYNIITYKETFEYADIITKEENCYRGEYYNPSPSSPCGGGLFPVIGDIYQYQIISGQHKLSKQIVYSNYDENGENPIITETNYAYNGSDHIQLTSKDITMSNGDKQTTYFTYSADMPNLENTITTTLLNMQTNHIINTVLKQETKVDDGSSEKTISGQIVNHKWYNFSQNNIYPSIIESYDTEKGYQKEVYVDLYDYYGNVTQFHAEDGKITSFIWGYESMYPIAKVENATYQQIMTILGSDLPLLNGNTLTDEEIITKINALRDQLPDALITSYTYEPLIGMTSATDVNNQTIYYEYDGLGRLILTRDQNNNILEKFDYHYSH